MSEEPQGTGSITMQAGELLHELKFVAAAAESRSTIPILSHVLFHARKDHASFAATDLNVTVRARIDAKLTGTTWEYALPKLIVPLIGDYVGEYGVDAPVTFTPSKRIAVTDGPDLDVRCGSSKCTLPVMFGADYPSVEQPLEEFSFGVHVPVLGSAIDDTMFAITKEETRFQLNGVLFIADRKTIELVATDGHRMSIRRIPGALEKARRGKAYRTLLSSNALKRIQSLPDAGVLQFGESGNTLHMRAGDREVMMRKTDINFPNYREVLNADLNRPLVLVREPLMRALKRMRHTVSPRTGAVRLDYGKDKLILSTPNSGEGVQQEHLHCEYDGEPGYIGLNYEYLIQGLAHVPTEAVRLNLKDENSQCRIEPVDGDVIGDFSYVVMPMRLA